MKIKVDNDVVFEYKDWQINVIKHDVRDELFEEYIKTRLTGFLRQLHDKSFARLKQEWNSKLLENWVSDLPINDEEYAKLVFSQPNYMNRNQIEAEMEKVLEERRIREAAILAGEMDEFY